MSKFFDYDPVKGVTEYFDYDEESETAKITYVQDIQPLLDWCKTNRNDGDVWKHGVKESWALYAKIPAVVQIELRKKGIDINNPNHSEAVFKEINQNYPYLKCTAKTVKAHH